MTNTMTNQLKIHINPKIKKEDIEDFSNKKSNRFRQLSDDDDRISYYYKYIGVSYDKIEFTDTNLPFYPMNGSSLFFQTVKHCFSRHHAMYLSPEILMQIIGCNIAKEINNNPKDYKSIAQDDYKEGKDIICVEHNELIIGEESPWHELLALFKIEIEKTIKNKDFVDNMVPEFSTLTDISRGALIITLMDSLKSYYDYECDTRCGIPEIRMEGTFLDWTKLYESVKKLSKIILSHNPGNSFARYFDELLPILHKLVEQSHPDTETDIQFWDNMYHLHSESGGPDIISGWLIKLINVDADEINASYVDSYISSVPFILKNLNEENNMQLISGCLKINVIDNAYKPELTFAVLHNNFANKSYLSKGRPREIPYYF